MMNLPRVALRAWALGLAALLWAALGRPEPPETESLPNEPRLDRNGEYMLPEATRKYLWDIEYLWFVVNQDVVPVFRRAIQKVETDPLRKFLAAGFSAIAFSGEGEATRHGIVTSGTRRKKRMRASRSGPMSSSGISRPTDDRS